MAHNCPNCDELCYCNGDIDDIVLPGGEDECVHECDEEIDDYGDDDPCCGCDEEICRACFTRNI